MSVSGPRIEPFGDGALLVSYDERIDPLINGAAHALAAAVRADQSSGAWGSPVPGYASVLVPYDPLRWTASEAESALSRIVGTLPAAGARVPTEAELTLGEAVLDIPVRYGGEHGPDLAEVAERCGLSPDAVVELHASVTYRAYLLGFAPGFAYLGTLPEALQLPRRDSPRTRVPAGSVGIAGPQTAVYPLSTPGGWHLIGRTDLPIWDPLRDPPALIAPGRQVRFVPVAG